ncbi:hypothetical protein QX233_18770 [Chryseobacterium gambrini]|jgi:hypothetical protein|uniref:Uncharacterized protein n=2 Tax=Chryseobacterium TaxID=59732 RepID=A0AAJ1R5W8_9FLAO|nr:MULTISPECIES: hypothetical protein [Chryseobacterium]MCF2219808.1 hypothetical protein [Chryseobacterium sp. PS-8]MDN4014520.1 hypothetical protein [Chryseobacterium gambrini]MDN4031504.1 hypothetical protein [Chryseobacterium gambrini]QWA38424.1 hypothetical protein KKI44_21555 [Chryseobacterium sp. ZHDP1]
MSDFNQNYQKPNQSNEDLHIGLKILSFCIPLAGAIIYFVKKDKEPMAAKSACNMALIGLAVNIVLTIIRLTLQK